MVEHLERTAVAHRRRQPARRHRLPRRAGHRRRRWSPSASPATPHAARDVAAALAPLADELGAAHGAGPAPAGHRAGRQRRPAHRASPDGSVEVQLRLAGDRVHLSVLDDGPGFDAARAAGGDARGPGRLGPVPRRPLRGPLGERARRAPPRVAGTGAPGCRLRPPTRRAARPATTVVAVAGEVTFSNVVDFDRALGQALDEARATSSSTSRTSRSSTPPGLSALLTASARGARARRHASRSCSREGEPPSIFRFRGVDRLLALYPSREAALRALAARSSARRQILARGPHGAARASARPFVAVRADRPGPPRRRRARRLRGGRAVRAAPGARGARRAGRDRLRDERRRDQRRGRRGGRGAARRREQAADVPRRTGARCARAT